jgi:hypothetical protein
LKRIGDGFVPIYWDLPNYFKGSCGENVVIDNLNTIQKKKDIRYL